MSTLANFDVFDKQSGSMTAEQMEIESKAKDFENLFAGLVSVPLITPEIQKTVVEAVETAENNLDAPAALESQPAGTIPVLEAQKNVLPQDVQNALTPEIKQFQVNQNAITPLVSDSSKSFTKETKLESQVILNSAKTETERLSAESSEIAHLGLNDSENLSAKEKTFVQETYLSNEKILPNEVNRASEPMKQVLLSEFKAEANLSEQIVLSDTALVSAPVIEKSPALKTVDSVPVPTADLQINTDFTSENAPQGEVREAITTELKLMPETGLQNEAPLSRTDSFSSSETLNSVLSIENTIQLKASEMPALQTEKLTEKLKEEFATQNSRIVISSEPVRISLDRKIDLENIQTEAEKSQIDSDVSIDSEAKVLAEESTLPVKINLAETKALSEFTKQLNPLEKQFSPESITKLPSLENIFASDTKTKPVLFFDNQTQIQTDDFDLPVKPINEFDENLDVKSEKSDVDGVLPDLKPLPETIKKNIFTPQLINPELFPSTTTAINKFKNLSGLINIYGALSTLPVTPTESTNSPATSTASTDIEASFQNDFPKIFREISNASTTDNKQTENPPIFTDSPVNSNTESVDLTVESEQSNFLKAQLTQTANIKLDLAVNKIDNTAQLTETEPTVFFDGLSMSIKKESKVVDATVTRFVENVDVFEQIDKPLLQAAILNAEVDEPQILKMRLRPAELGTIEIKLEKTDAGTVNVHFQTETEVAGHILAESFEQLKTSLQNSGVQVERLEVVTNQFLSGGNQRRENESSQTATAGNQTKEGKSFGGNADEPDDLKQNQSKRLLSMRA